MLRFSGSCQNPGSSVLDELQQSNGLLWNNFKNPPCWSSQVTFIYIALLIGMGTETRNLIGLGAKL